MIINLQIRPKLQECPQKYHNCKSLKDQTHCAFCIPKALQSPVAAVGTLLKSLLVDFCLKYVADSEVF